MQSSPGEAILGTWSTLLAVHLGEQSWEPGGQGGTGQRGLGGKEGGREEGRGQVGGEEGRRRGGSGGLTSRTVSHSHLGVPCHLLIGNYLPASN